MRLEVSFYSYFKDLTGCACITESMPEGSTLGDLMGVLWARYPRLAPWDRSTLTAVGVEYQDRQYVLRDGDEVALFPPVQGG